MNEDMTYPQYIGNRTKEKFGLMLDYVIHCIRDLYAKQEIRVKINAFLKIYKFLNRAPTTRRADNTSPLN